MRDAFGNGAALNDDHAQIVLRQRLPRFVLDDEAIKPLGFGGPSRLVLGNRLLEQVVRIHGIFHEPPLERLS